MIQITTAVYCDILCGVVAVQDYSFIIHRDHNFCVHMLQMLYQQYDIVRKSANLASGCPPKNLGHKMHNETQPLALLFFS